MLTSAFAAVGAGRGAGGGRLPPAMGNAGSGGGAVAATESRARGHARPRGVCTPARGGGALAKTAVSCPPARWQPRGVGADGGLSSSVVGLPVSSAGSAPPPPTSRQHDAIRRAYTRFALGGGCGAPRAFFPTRAGLAPTRPPHGCDALRSSSSARRAPPSCVRRGSSTPFLTGRSS